MVSDIELFESGAHCFSSLISDFCLWGWMKSEVYKRKVDIQDDLVTSILDADARIKKHEDQLRRTTSDFRTRVAK
jgi:hypothetical protein